MSDKKRQIANLEILNELKSCVNAYPDLRFGQLLETVGALKTERSDDGSAKVDDPFYEESAETLERIRKTLKGGTR